MRYYLPGLYQEILSKDVFLCAQAIGFKGLVALVPALVLSTGLLGQLLSDEQAFSAIAGFIGSLLPTEEAEFFSRFLQRLVDARNVVTGFGVVTLLLSLLSLQTSLRVAVSRMFTSPQRRPRSIGAGYLFDLRMSLQVGILMLFTFALSSTLQMLDHAVLDQLVEAGLEHLWTDETLSDHTRSIAFIVTVLGTALMLAQLYYFVPLPHPPLASVLCGAFVAALLWELAKYGFTLYAVNIGHFHRYEDVVRDLVTLAEIFGLILAYVLWVYCSGLILCIGALITVLHERRYQPAE